MSGLHPYQSSQPEASPETNRADGGSRLTLKTAALRMQIIVGAIIMGVVMIATVLMLVAANQERQPQAMLVWVAFVIWLSSTSMGIVWPMLGIGTNNQPGNLGSKVEQAVQNPDQPIDESLKPLINVWNRNAIIRAAMLEGGAVVCLILWLVSAESSLLALVGVSLSFMLVTFPTVNRLRRWLEACVNAQR